MRSTVEDAWRCLLFFPSVIFRTTVFTQNFRLLFRHMADPKRFTVGPCATTTNEHSDERRWVTTPWGVLYNCIIKT